MTPEKLRYLRGLISPKSNSEISSRGDYKHIEAFSPEKFKQVLEGADLEVPVSEQKASVASDKLDMEKICQDFVALYQNTEACLKAKTPEEYNRARENYKNYEISAELEIFDDADYDEGKLPMPDTRIPLEDRNEYNGRLLAGALSAYTLVFLSKTENQAENIMQTAKEYQDNSIGYIEQKADEAIRDGTSLSFSQKETNMLSKQSAGLQKQLQTESEKAQKRGDDFKNYVDYAGKKIGEFAALTPGQLQTADYTKDTFVKDVYKNSVKYLKDHQKGRTDTKAFDKMLIDRLKNQR